MALDRLAYWTLLAHRFLYFRAIFLCFSYSCVAVRATDKVGQLPVGRTIK